MRNTLDVSGAVIMRNTLDVSGAVLMRNTLDVSGAVLMRNTLDVSGAVIMRNRLDVSGAAYITGNLNYHIDVERITYQLTPSTSVLPESTPGYWEASANRINLYMPIQPTMYVIDGSTGSAVDLSVNLVTPLPYTQPSGMTFTFVARNTTGTGHRLLYPYVTGTHTTLIPAPISTALVCIGNNDYSSSS